MRGRGRGVFFFFFQLQQAYDAEERKGKKRKEKNSSWKRVVGKLVNAHAPPSMSNLEIAIPLTAPL